MKKFILMALLFATPAMAQAPAANLQYGWAPKPAAAPFIAPNRPHWKLADLLKSHADRKSWSQVVVRDATGLTGAYIQMAPGEKSPKVMYSDTVIFFVVQAGQMRVTIEGVEPFVASKGFLVQVPSARFVQAETIGEEPSLRFEVTQTQAPAIYAEGETPPASRGVRYDRTGYYTAPAPYGAKRPYINFQKDIVEGGMAGGGAVQDDLISANINRQPSVPRPPDSDKGHFHIGTSEFWFILEGEVNFLIEGGPYFTAAQGDVVYAPAGRWHRATSGGVGAATRLSIHPVASALNALDPVNPGR
jgi:mannose-6-phosphate isomerase-like protein (cupin superfamily)